MMILSTKRFLFLLVVMCFLSFTMVSSIKRPRTRQRMERGLQQDATDLARKGGGKSGMGMKDDYWDGSSSGSIVEGAEEAPSEEDDDDDDDDDEDEGKSGEEDTQKAKEKEGKGSKGKSDGNDEDDVEDDEDDGSDGDDTDNTILNAEETLLPTETVATDVPGSTATDDTLTVAPSGRVTTTSPTEMPGQVTQAPTDATAAEETPAPSLLGTLFLPNTGNTPTPATVDSTEEGPTANNGQPGGDGGIFDGEGYYHRHLEPFAVAIEGDEVATDLGITSCLFDEMQKNITNLLNIEMDNFTIVKFDDQDGDGYKMYHLYFAGFGEFVGLPVISDEYFQEVQLNVLGNNTQFIQNCLDARWLDSGNSYTTSPLQHDQATSGLQSNQVLKEGAGEGDDDKKRRTRLIIGLTVAAVVVALCGIVFASRLLRRKTGTEEERATLK